MIFRFVPANSIELHTAESGSAHQPVMILLHGFPEFWFSWRHVMPVIAGHFHVFAPDLRGYNLSSKPQAVEHYSIRVLVTDVVQFMQAVSPKPVILVGHDWGGAIAWAVAATHPQLLRKLIILNAPHPSTFVRDLFLNPQQQTASQYMHQLRSESAEQSLSARNFEGLRRMMGVEGSWTESETAEYLKAWSQPGSFTAMLNYYRAMRVVPPDFSVGEPPRSHVPTDAVVPSIEILVPTLVVWGERDHALLPSLLDGLDRYVPQLTIQRMPGATHWVQQDAPAEVAEAIIRFASV
jgi:pimeloyl-ACP methyl ester carboxylesterase